MAANFLPRYVLPIKNVNYKVKANIKWKIEYLSDHDAETKKSKRMLLAN